jgi:hypothetical protein
MSLYHSISYPYQPNEQCLLGEMPIKWQWESDDVKFDFLFVHFKNVDCICSTPNWNLWEGPYACPNQCPSTTAFHIHLNPTNNVWWMRCLLNVHGSPMEVFSRGFWPWDVGKNIRSGSKTKPKSMRQTFCMPLPMSLYHSISHPYGPNKQCLMRMRCLFNVHGSQMNVFSIGFWPWDVGKKKIRIKAKQNQNPWDRPFACPYQCPSITAFPVHMDPTNNVWWMRCIFNAHGSQIMLIFKSRL